MVITSTRQSPGFRRMMERLGVDGAEALRLDTLAKQEAAATAIRRDKFSEDVMSLLYDKYTLRDGIEVNGNAFSFIQQEMRSRGWRGLSAYKFESMLTEKGFQISRGRGPNGKGMRATCNVIHLKQR